ncbi:MAG: 2-oxoacid:acceptor oxidoreductase family protein [Bacillota bacterium]|nr:2-oxoacid:acceptor oxidoreductase family protein [Bacillota bacterium]
MLEKITFAGFGGQGVLLMGQLLAYAAMIEDAQVSWLPSYGPEMRGGTANCSVTISDKPVASPIIDHPNSVVAMNRPSLDKFEDKLAAGGRLLINSSIIDRKALRQDVQVYYVPCNEIALELGEARVSNIVMLGAFLQISQCVSTASLIESLAHKLGKKKAHLIPINEQALARGAAAVR